MQDQSRDTMLFNQCNDNHLTNQTQKRVLDKLQYKDPNEKVCLEAILKWADDNYVSNNSKQGNNSGQNLGITQTVEMNTNMIG